MSGFSFDEIREKKFNEIKRRYPKIDSLMLPGLWLIQEQEGWISLDAMKYLAKKLETTPAQVYSVATFYTMFNLQPKGKYHICICKTLSCKLNGSEKIKETLQKELGIKAGETTKDGVFSLEEVECLGACDMSPVISLNDEYIGNLNEEKIKNIIKELKDAAKDS
ncbi:MAG: NADH-quinone oxidoreductase subunit NuoE [Epsilonproteobacteria bacterium]|nr:NADH-quinone oxidoreductase subunit NuoE [Campylobacterota bacterium]